jgi:hypothetical protein
MIRVDNRDEKDIAAVIEWCQKDPFWGNTILSAAKLRQHYDQLVLKMGVVRPIPSERHGDPGCNGAVI